MNSVEKSVLYLGHDQSLFDNLKAFSQESVKSSAIMVQSYEEGSLCKLLLENPLKLIFVDFTTIDLKISSLLEEVIYLKRMYQFRSLLFVGIFDGHDYGSFNPLIFISGFQFSYIKGCDEDLMFKDTFSIVFSLGALTPTFARANNIYKPMRVGIASSLNSLGWNSFILETDVNPIELSLDLSLAAALPDLDCQTFEIESSFDSGKCYPMLYCHRLKLPMGTPWEVSSSKVVQEDSQRNWLEFNYDKQVKNNHFVKIISKKPDLLLGLFELDRSTPFIIDQSEFLSDEDIVGQLNVRKPDLIFVDVELEGDNTIDFLESLVGHIKSIHDYQPVLILSNTPSAGAALQKLFGYTFILATKDHLNTEFIKSFLLSFQLKKEISFQLDSHLFNSSDERRYVDVFHELRLHTLSEHEVTFNSNIEIPMFSVLHFKMPIDFYGTLVPIQHSGGSGTYFYKAVIHGLPEKKLEVLRKFVNKIISQPLKDLSEEHIQDVLKSMEEKPLIQEKIQVVVPEPEEKPEAVRVEKEKKISKFSLYAGKSKL